MTETATRTIETEMAAPTLPFYVLKAMARARHWPPDHADWQIDRLSRSNPIYRVTTPVGSGIIKQSVHPTRELIVSRLFTAMGIPCFAIDPLSAGWLLFEDLQRPNLKEYLQSGQTRLTSQLFERLGAVAMQSDLVGMRDRKMNNILVNEHTGARGLELVIVDYEGAFAAGWLDRFIRPHRYITYLTTRLFFDVIDAMGDCAESQGPFDSHELLTCFHTGMLNEQARINERLADLSQLNQRLTPRQQLVLKSRIIRPEKLTRCLERGLARAERKTRNSDE